MSTCQAKVGEFTCGLLPLKDGLCEQHYHQASGGKPIQEKCEYDWGPLQKGNFEDRMIPENTSSKSEQASRIFKN